MHEVGMMASASSSAFQELSRFEIISKDIKGLEDGRNMGSGSFGVVYAVTVRGQPRIAKRLHSIFLRPDVSYDEHQGIKEKFLNECLLLSKLNHRNVVQFVGVHFKPSDRSDVTLIMEQLNMDLEAFLDPRQRPDIATFTKLSILFDVSSGLLYLHTQLEKPIIHRDLTAANVLLTKDFKQAKIADLGVARLIENFPQRAATRTVCPGTLAYMPPEALTDNPKYDTPLDVFSFGQLALYVALQQFPQVALELIHDEQSVKAYQTGEIAILKRKKWINKLPEDYCIRDLILHCLKDDPDERPSTEYLNKEMKVVCRMGLNDLEVNNVVGLPDDRDCGSYGAIYKVTKRILTLHSDTFTEKQSSTVWKRLEQECRILSTLNDPNVMKFIGVSFNPTDHSDVTIILEHMHLSLEEFLNLGVCPHQNLGTNLSILLDISFGMIYLHTQLKKPIIHCNLTAENVFLNNNLKQAKIAHFGVSKLIDNELLDNKLDTPSMTLAYMPPEILRGDSNLDTSVDLFSFGHLALYVVLQQFPNVSSEQFIQGDPVIQRMQWISKLHEECYLRNLIVRCLQSEPCHRPSTYGVCDMMTKIFYSANEAGFSVIPIMVTKHDITLQNQFAKLCRISRNGELDLLKEYLYYSKEILNYSTPKGTTILHEAVDGDQPDVVQLLLLHDFNPDVHAKGGLTPLHLAVIKGQVDCVRALIDNGADITIKDDQGQDAITKAELLSKKHEAIVKYLCSKQIIQFAEAGDLDKLEKRLNHYPKPEVRDMEEAVLMAIRKDKFECVPLLIMAGARHLDYALYLAIQLERIEAIAILLLCKAAIVGDIATIRSLLSEPLEPFNVPWYMTKVHQILSQGDVKTAYPIAISILEKKYKATKELLLRTDLDMGRKLVDWSKLKLSILDSSLMYSIAPWVVNLKLVGNHLGKLPSEMFSATQLRRLELSQNLLETVSADLFALPNLEYLSLDHNRLKEIPETNNWSASLISLDVSENLLSTIPQGIQYSNIEILNLSKNQFVVVPRCLSRIRTLTTLDLSSMPILSLPKEMENLENLVNLNVTNTKLRGGIRGISRAHALSSKPCNLIKLILLCHTDVVKVLMLSKLKSHFKTSQLASNKPFPEMDVFQWSFKPLLSRKDKLCFNTWLFGSHYSCRSIYPCFFTSGALYVIVWDLTTTADLREQIKPYIDLLICYVSSPNILVIAVLPEQFETWHKEKQAEVLAARLNTFFSKPSYQSLSYHGVLMVVANIKEGKSNLKQRLYDAAQQMIVNGQHIVSRQVPETYFSLIPVLEKEQQAFRSQSKPGVLEESTILMQFSKALTSDPPDKMELPDMIEFLKEVGYLLHYKDPNDRLDQCYFIRPTWLYNTLLQVVRHTLEHCNHLFLTYGELCTLTNVSWNKNIARALIRLMIRYAIVLPTRRDQYLITCLLPHSQPPSDVLYCGALRRQFAPKVRSIPVDLWSRLLCSIITNLSCIIDVSKLKESKNKSKEMDSDIDDGTDKHGSATSTAKQPPMYLNRDSATATTEKLKEISSISPTTKLASRILRKTSPMKHFGRERSSSPASSDSSKTPPISSTPVSRGIQVSPWYSSEGSRLQRRASALPKKRAPSRYSVYAKPVTIDRGVEIWDSGMTYNHKGIKFSIFPCVSNVSTVEERGIEICCTRDTYGYAIMARLCWLVQRNLDERFPYLFSTETPLQKHELTQIAICPTCLEKNERNPSCFLIEACVHALQLKGEHNCRYHTEVIPLRDIVPDYLLLDFSPHLYLTKMMFEYNEAKPLHRGRQMVLHKGHFNGKEVAVKMYHQVDSRSITLSLSCVRREIDMLSSLNHPNIIKTLGFCLDPACVLVEKAPLGNLCQKLMDAKVKISRTVRFHVSCQVASALSYLHRHDIIYRTLKASSILLWSLDFNTEVSVKLTNFERAAYQPPSGLMSRITFSSYPAPEMVRYSFREEYTERVDIYSFGVFLYELVTRRQPYGGTNNGTHSQKPKLSGGVTTSYSTIVMLMEECWQEDSMARPSADDLLLKLSRPFFQCYIASQVLRDFVSVRGCCFVPSVRQIWVYGEYSKTSPYVKGEIFEGSQVFILNADNLTVQGSLELNERVSTIYTVDNKVWVGMTELTVHAYDTTTFQFTNRFHLDDSATIIADNDCYVFVGQANGQINCYSKLGMQRGDCQPTVVEIGDKGIFTMIAVGDIIWLGCGNELVVLSAEDEVMIEQRVQVCESSDQVCGMIVSYSTNTVWCLGRNSHCITSWDIHTMEKKRTVDLSEDLKWICCELNYDPSFLRMVSIERVSDTLWVGLSCGVIMILSDTEQPEKIIHFKAHKQATKCLLKIPHSDDLHQQHDYPLILSGGFGEVSSLSSTASEQSGVVMLWHAFTANEFSKISKRHKKYIH